MHKKFRIKNLSTFLFPVIIFASSITHGQNYPLPKDLLNEKTIIEFFRGPLQIKLNELPDNYIVDAQDSRAIYSSHIPVNCIGTQWPKSHQLAQIQYLNQDPKNKNTVEEVGRYFGCDTKAEFTEIVKREGNNIKLLDWSDFFRGLRDFTFKENYTRYFYSLDNPDNQNIFTMVAKREKSKTLTEFFVLGQKFLSIRRVFGKDESTAFFKFFPFEVNYVRPHGAFSFKSTKDPHTWTVIAGKKPEKRVNYISPAGWIAPRNHFLKNIQDTLFNGPLKLLQTIVSYHVHAFPKTEVIGGAGGGQNQRILNELNLSLTRLISGNELEQVRALIQSYIQDINDGKLIIVDKRE